LSLDDALRAVRHVPPLRLREQVQKVAGRRVPDPKLAVRRLELVGVPVWPAHRLAVHLDVMRPVVRHRWPLGRLPTRQRHWDELWLEDGVGAASRWPCAPWRAGPSRSSMIASRASCSGGSRWTRYPRREDFDVHAARVVHQRYSGRRGDARGADQLITKLEETRLPKRVRAVVDLHGPKRRSSPSGRRTASGWCRTAAPKCGGSTRSPRCATSRWLRAVGPG
jgi:hypothetical protein